MRIDIYNENPIIQLKVAEDSEEKSNSKIEDLKVIFDHDISFNQTPIRAIWVEQFFIDPRWAFVFKNEDEFILQSAYLKPDNLLQSIFKKRNKEILKLDPGFVYFMAYNHDFENYYHWTLQCLPALSLYFSLKNIYPNIKLLLPGNLPGFARQYLDQMKINTDKEVCFVNLNDKLLHAEKLIYPSFLGGEFAFNISPSILSFTGITLKHILNTPKQPAKKLKIVYCARLDTKNRKIVNEAELIIFLERNFGAEIFINTNKSVIDQANKFFEADILIAPHGAGLSNLLFSRRGSHVIELMPDKYINPCFATLAVNKQCQYHPLVFNTISISGHQHEYEWEINIPVLKNLINKLVNIPA